MNCLACSEDNCDNIRCKDILDKQQEEAEPTSIETLIEELWN